MKQDLEQRQRQQPRWTAPASFLSLLAFQQYLSRACGALLLLALLSVGGPHSAAASSRLLSLPLSLSPSLSRAEADPTPAPGTPLSAAACPTPRCAAPTDAAGMDYFPHKSLPTISSFSVVYYPSYKVLTETRTDTQFVLYQCGQTPPTASATAGFRPSAKFFQVPLQTIAVDESISAGYLELLGERHKIRFFDVSYVSSPCLLRLAEEGRLQTLEPSYGNASLRAEQLAQVDAYFASNVFDPDPKAIPQSSSSDDSLLSRAEWLKFYAYFFNKEFAATDLWTGIKNRYGQFKLAAAEAAQALPAKPAVAFVNYQAPSSWAPAGEVSLSAAAYKRTLAEDGGAVFPIQEDKSWPLDQRDSFLSSLAAVQLDHLLDESYYDDPTLLGYTTVLRAFGLNESDSSSSYPFLSHASVWREDARGSLKETAWGRTYADDWFEDAQVESDALLLDFLRIVQPTLYKQIKDEMEHSASGDKAMATEEDSGLQRLWFRNMGANESVQFESALQCTDLSAPNLPLLERVRGLPTSAFHCPDYFHESSPKLPVWAIVLIAAGVPLLLGLATAAFLAIRKHRALRVKYELLELQMRGKGPKETV